jgi:predicted DNA-binding transcriptional regulator YafY
MASIHRIFFVHDEIMKFGKVTTLKIVDKFEVTTRQVQRDIREMKFMGAPVEYCAEAGGYIYKKPWNILDYADKKTLLFYLFASKMAANLSLMPVISKRLLSEIEDIYLKDYGEVLEKISYEFSDTEPFNVEIITKIIDSMQTKTAIDIEYCNVSGETSKRTIEPWHLVNYCGRWYVLAWCQESCELRTFYISRILKTLGNFAQREPFSKEIDEPMLKKCLHEGYGIFKTDSTREVTIRFYEPILNFIRHRKWHPKQITKKTQFENKPCIELTIPVGDYTEITSMILSLAPNAEAVSPPDFREQWLERVKESVERFGN